MGTPLTWEKFTAWKEGTIYGVPSTGGWGANRPRHATWVRCAVSPSQRRVPPPLPAGDKLRHAHIFKPPTPIKQLFLAGCDANVFGIMGAMMG